MTSHLILAEELQRGMRVHIQPHQVHGHPAGFLPDGKQAGTAESDVEVDDVEIIGPHQCDISISCHPCYLGGSADVRWVTTYHLTDPVLVIGFAPGQAA